MSWFTDLFKNKDPEIPLGNETVPPRVICKRNCVSKAFDMGFAAKNMGHFPIRFCFSPVTPEGNHAWCEAFIDNEWQAISDRGPYDVIITDGVKNGHEADPSLTLTLREFFEQQVDV